MLRLNLRFPERGSLDGCASLRARLLVSLFCLSFSVLPFAARSQTSVEAPPFVSRSEDELLILEVRLDQDRLTDSFPAYPTPGGLLVPLGELTRLLGLGLEVDVTAGTASGFVISESRRFELNARSRTVIVAGTEYRFSATDVEVHQDDIYVDTRVLRDWLPLNFTIDLFSSQLKVQAREPLPMQLRKKREELIRKSLASLGYTGEKYPRSEIAYKLFDGPFIDQSLRFSTVPAEDGRENSLQYATYLAGDLLYHQFDAFVSGSAGEGESDSRATMSRRDPEPRLLGPLRAREYAVGEVLSPGSKLILLPTTGPGALLSNFPLQLQTQFDRHTFQGDLPPGWEVELYQNNALIAFQQARADGRYLFENVPLLFGQNAFRLLFYGPQGQKREEVHRFNIGDSLAPPGVLYYRAVTDEPETGFERTLIEADYGITKQISIHGLAAEAQLEDGRHRYAQVAGNGYWNALFGRLELAKDLEGGEAAHVAMQTRIGPLNLSFDHTELLDFRSETFRPSYGEIARRTGLRLDAIIPFATLTAVPLTFEVERDELEEGGSVYRVLSRFSGQYRRTFFTHQLSGLIFDDIPQAAESQVTGSFLISRQLRYAGVRGEMSYDIEPNLDLKAVAITSETFAIPGYVFQAGITRTIDAGRTNVFLGANKREGRFALGAEAGFSDPGGASFGLNLFVGLHRDSRTNRWSAGARSAAGIGAASILVFLDRNANGRFDQGDQPLKDVGFFINRASSRELTGENGVALLTTLSAYQETEISLSSATIEEPNWIPAKKGISFIPRPGKPARFDFPVIVTGDLTGTVFIRRRSETSEAGGVLLELVGSDGKVIRRTTTAYDGFFELTLLPPGPYRLRVAEEQRQRLKLTGQTERPVMVPASGETLDGMDLILQSPNP